MNRKFLTIALAIGLLAGFFLPLLSGIKISPYDIVIAPGKSNDVLMKYIWVLIPISAILLLIGALNNEQYFLGRGIWAWLPFATIVFILIRLYFIEGDSKVPFVEFVKSFGVGFWIMFASSLILAFSWSKPR
ncbi:MAG TPA: hypothetical protein VHM26_02860 [Chitinophagaceae bacterium]|jgi:hypothetical protein|nr:hypothetical protein [Chitinophagaceae bacterium]